MRYYGFVTAIMEHETLPHMDEDETRQALADAADIYANAPDRLKATILAAARSGMTHAKIARAIHYAYTYEYVAKLVRDDRKANPGEYKREPAP